MATKLTLTMEDKVIDSAKKYAKKSGKSLSHLVETYLKSIATKEPKVAILSQKVSKLMGVIKVPGFPMPFQLTCGHRNSQCVGKSGFTSPEFMGNEWVIFNHQCRSIPSASTRDPAL